MCTLYLALTPFANTLREVTAPYPSSHGSSSQSPIAINSISLPNPQPLLPSLLKAGVSHEVATAVSEVYQTRAEELRKYIQESIRKITDLPVVTSASSSDRVTSKVVSTFTEVYLRRLEQWEDEVTQRVEQASKTPTKAGLKNSRTFNHEYVPLLEHFFEENPFPTHADKVFLAKKSNMQYRQIHVWFQNRRNRTKKDDRPLRKKPISEGATKPLDKLYERMKGYMVQADVPSQPRNKVPLPTGDSELEVAENTTSNDVFSQPPPLHAFPSRYPPICHYDPFPCKSGVFSFSKPEWRRTSPNKPQSPPISVDDLVEMFSQLNVRGDSRPKGSPRLHSYAATAAITVVPSRAPLPSLIPPKDTYPVRVVVSCSSVNASAPRLHAFRSPSPTSKPVTLVPLPVSSNSSEPPTKRKTAPLPRRFPGRMRSIQRDTTPPSSESSSASASPRIFSSESHSRSSSFSSINSSPSPPNLTFNQELPYSFGSPCRSPSESPLHPHDDVLGDFMVSPPPPISWRAHS